MNVYYYSLSETGLDDKLLIAFYVIITAKLAKNVVDPSIWSHKVSNNYAAAVLGISDSYLSTVSSAKFTNSSGSSFIF